MTDVLIPILVAAYGRTGTTALMALLATDDCVAVDRCYPFENRNLTYLSKFALLTGRPGTSTAFNPVHLVTYGDHQLGPPPWPTLAAGSAPPLMPTPSEWLTGLWRVFSTSVQKRFPRSTQYAEKVPHWVAPMVRQSMTARTLHVVRDPRDVFLSARAFARARGAIGFGMESTSEIEQARHTAHQMLSFYENARDDRHREDAICLRYEDLVAQPTACADRLNAFLSLQLSRQVPEAVTQLDSHKTSPSPATSVGQWRAEPLPHAVRVCLEMQLHDLMVDNGYDLSADSLGPQEVPLGGPIAYSRDGTFERANECLQIAVTTGDFNIELPPEPFAADTVTELWACVRGATGDHCSVYWRGAHETFAEERCLHVLLRPARHWEVLRFPLGCIRAGEA